MILIVGASGNLGKQLAISLLKKGKPVRAMVRQLDKAKSLEEAGAEIVVGNLIDKASLDTACQGVKTVVSAAHGLLGRGAQKSKNVDLTGQKSLIDSAKENGVTHFIFISGLNVSHDHPIDFLRYKQEIETYLKSSGLNYTIIKAAAFYIPHASMIGDGIQKNGKANILGHGQTKRNLIAIEDVVAMIEKAIDDHQLFNQIISIGGPDNLSNDEVAQLYGEVLDVTPKIAHLPHGVLKFMSSIIRPFHPGISTIMRWAMYSDNHSETFDASTLTQYGIQPTPLEDWIKDRVSK